MIGVKIQGRFGNQLFQYAFAYATGKKLKTSFYMDQTSNLLDISTYFNLPFEPGCFLEDRIFNLFKNPQYYQYRLKRLYYYLLKRYFTPNHVAFDAGAEIDKVYTAIKNGTLFEGYFQSETYFKGYEANIRRILNIKPGLQLAYQQKYGEVFKNKEIVTIHIRRTDYLNLGHMNLGADDLSLPMDYYHRVIKQVQANNVLFVFISDEVDFINKEFAHVENKIVANDTLINDFQHLLNADVCIIANSTFSWWGAWLNNKPHKKVIAPQYFMGHRIHKEWPPAIYPPNWEQVNVND